MKYCNGSCGRPLPEEAFYLARGRPQPECKACHRVLARESFRRRMRRRSFRRAEATRKREEYSRRKQAA